MTYFKSQFDIYNLLKLFLNSAVFKMYWIYHMPPSHCWMTGSVAMEINTGPHSLVLKKKIMQVYLDIKEIRPGILWKLNKCHLPPIFLGCVFISMEMCVSIETLIQVEMCMYKHSEGGDRSREQWTMKTALFRMAFCCCELCGREAKEARKARLWEFVF